MKTDLTSRLKTGVRIEDANRKCIKRYCFLSARDLKSKIKSGQRKRRSTYQNGLWLRIIRTLIFCWSNFKFSIRSIVIFNMKMFCEHKL